MRKRLTIIIVCILGMGAGVVGVAIATDDDDPTCVKRVDGPNGSLELRVDRPLDGRTVTASDETGREVVCP